MRILRLGVTLCLAGLFFLPWAPGLAWADESATHQDWDLGYKNARRLSEAGSSEEALRAWNRLLADFPGAPDALLGRGISLLKAGDPQAAAGDFERILATHPGYVDAWVLLGDSRSELGQFSAAEQAYAEAARRDPLYPGIDGRIDAARTAAGVQVLGPETVGVRDWRWRAGAGVEYSTFSGRRDHWLRHAATLERRTPGATVLGTVARVRKFGLVDHQLGTELWLPRRLWTLHANLAVSPNADIVPRWDGTLELMRTLPEGWEASLGARHLRYPGNRIDIVMAGIARYLREWYMGAQLGRSSGSAGGTGFLNARVRRYTTDEAFVELSLGAAREEIQIAAGNFVARDNLSAGLRWRMPIGPAGHITLGLTATDEANGPTGWHSGLEYQRTW